jgi:DNA polymerase III subunit delta
MPALSTEMLAARLAKGKPVPVVLLLGQDAYLRSACRDLIVEASLDPASRDWGYRRFSGEDDDLVEILAQARTVPMLVPRQVIVVSGLEAIEHASEAAREAAVDELSAYLDDPAPFTILLLEAAALDQRMRLAKLLAQKAQVVTAELPEDPKERARLAVALAVRIARERQAAIEPDAAEELVDLCDANLAAIANEIEKLATYVGPGQPIRQSDVAALVVSEKKYSVWELADMLASRDRGRALTFLDSLLREGEAPPALVGAMAWMYRRLIETQELGPHVSAWDVAGRLRMRRPTAEIAVRYAKKIPRAKLVEGLRALYEADSRLKSASADNRAIMEFLVARLIGP